MLKLNRKLKAFVLSIFGACSILGSSAAWGTVTCQPLGTAIMVIFVSDDTVTIKRASTAAGSNILINGSECLNINDVAFNVDNTNVIAVISTIGTDADENVVIDLANGPFAPGTPTDETSLPEIEFDIELGLGTNTVSILGSSSQDTFDIGMANTDGPTGPNQNVDAIFSGEVAVGDILINMNAGRPIVDDDADILIVDPAFVQLAIKGREGPDILDGRAETGTGVGSRPQVPLQLHGGPGADTINGGPLNDSLFGNGVVAQIGKGTKSSV